MERGRSSGYGATPVHRRSAAALQAKAARSVPRAGSVGHHTTAVLDRVGSGVSRDPIGLGVSGARSGARASSTGPTDASKLLQFASASKVKGGLSGAIGSAAATAVGPVAATRMSSQSRLGSAKYTSATHSNMWPPHPPKTFGAERRNPPVATAANSSAGRSGDSSGDDGTLSVAPGTTGPTKLEGTRNNSAAGKNAREHPGAALPSVAVIQRSKEEKAHSAERLNMDNQQLSACPLLIDEQKLRLLNYQSNQICTIQNLEGLPNLIFLDLYNNRIKRVVGLDKVQGLRVLMLGKNRLTTIENLDGLTRLDVLDLHSNQIVEVENLSHLSALRVLNLAGNRITCLQGVEGLVSLTELNLRRNALAELRDLSGLVSLQRLFLSHNQLKSTGHLRPLGVLPQLIELTVEHNPLCSVTPAVYRPELLAYLTTTLSKLDAQDVTQTERNAAQEAHVARVSTAAASSTTAVEYSDGKATATGSGSDSRHSVRSTSSPNSQSQSQDLDNTTVQPASAMGQGMSVGHMRSREVGNGLPRRPSSPGESARVARIRDVMWDWEVRTRHAGRASPDTVAEDGAETALGFYELVAAKQDDDDEMDTKEARGQKRVGTGTSQLTQLSIYGWSALGALSNPAHAHVSAVSLQFITVERMVAANLSAKLAALPALSSISFAHNHVRSIGELECLIGGFLDARAAASHTDPDTPAARTGRLRSLTVRENPLCELGLYRDLVIRMSEGGTREMRGGSLRYLNGVAITQTERSSAMELFLTSSSQPILSGVSAGSPERTEGAFREFEQPYIGSGYAYSAPPVQAGVMSYEHAQKVAKHEVSAGLKVAKEMEQKINLLNDLWPKAVADVVETTLHELDDLENWMALSLSKLV